MRTPQEGVSTPALSIDERGRAPGRGAYLCAERACWKRALDSDVLGRALRAAVTETDRDTLRAFAARRFAAQTLTEGAR